VKILIVDDNPTNRKLLRLTLQSQRHQVAEAAEGAEALKLLTSEKFDAMISDILMPNMDGYRLCFEVRKTPEIKDLPIILYSSTYLSPSDRDLALRFGASAFLEKPAAPEKLEEVLREVAKLPVPPTSAVPGDDLGALKQYSERLITKIEEKNLELMRRSEDLEASEKKFRQLAENIQEVFWITEADFSRILYISPAYEVTWGRPCEEVYRNPLSWIEAIHPDDRPRIEESAATLAKQPDLFQWDYRIRRPDGSIRWIQDRGFPVRDSHGVVYRFAGVSEDVTERKSLQDQLLQSQKMEAIGRLAGGIAHDFNNLLTAINGYSQIALDRVNSLDPLHADLEEIQKAGQRAAGLTRQLLAFSRKQVLQPKVVDLNQLVSDTERLLKRLIGEDIELRTALDPGTGRVLVDPGQVEQVIVNLAVNARDAMPKGGVLKLETSLAELDEAYAAAHPSVTPGRYVLLAVSDTGTGLSDKVKAHLFEPFFTTKEQGKGTGLGLATVHGIIKQSRGHVAVYSELGQGTVFKVYLPRTDASVTATAAPPPSSDKLGGHETILLVEDDDVVRTLARTVLTRAGYKIIEARRGDEALAIADGHPSTIHLVLTDLIMPGMNGADLTRTVKARHPAIRTLYASGYTDLSMIKEDALDLAAPFLGKPFTPASLLLKVREVLDQREPK
jgi:two-component system, cell cycle sensor histidine kinase and response regulator CckA